MKKILLLIGLTILPSCSNSFSPTPENFKSAMIQKLNDNIAQLKVINMFGVNNSKISTMETGIKELESGKSTIIVDDIIGKPYNKDVAGLKYECGSYNISIKVNLKEESNESPKMKREICRSPDEATWIFL